VIWVGYVKKKLPWEDIWPVDGAKGPETQISTYFPRGLRQGYCCVTVTPASRNITAAASNSSGGMLVLPGPTSTALIPAWISVRLQLAHGKCVT
jgi:hypothetical protein